MPKILKRSEQFEEVKERVPMKVPEPPSLKKEKPKKVEEPTYDDHYD